MKRDRKWYLFPAVNETGQEMVLMCPAVSETGQDLIGTLTKDDDKTENDSDIRLHSIVEDQLEKSFIWWEVVSGINLKFILLQFYIAILVQVNGAMSGKEQLFSLAFL